MTLPKSSRSLTQEPSLLESKIPMRMSSLGPCGSPPALSSSSAPPPPTTPFIASFGDSPHLLSSKLAPTWPTTTQPERRDTMLNALLPSSQSISLK